MNIKYIISSFKDSYNLALIKLVESLLNSGVNYNDIYAFVGGNHQVEKINWDYDINYYLVDHNSYDITALIGISNINIDYDYVFLLHDTCWVSDDFMSKIHDRVSNINGTRNIALSPYGCTMNIGMYNKQFITSNYETINTVYKNKTKSFYVTSEDRLIKSSMEQLTLNPNKFQLIEPHDVYNTNVLRRVEYYSDIGLYKAKSNWKQGNYITTL